MENAPGAETQFPFLDSSMTRTIERPVVLAGRLYNPDAADEVVVTPGFAGAFHKHPGDHLTLDLASVKQANSGYDGSDGTAPAGPRVRVRIVGVVRSPWITDEPDVPGELLASPALWAKYQANVLGAPPTVYINALIRLRGGAAAIPAFRAGLARVTGRDDIDVWNNSVNFGDPARRVTSYEAACLLAFALAALITALFLVGQAIARYVSVTTADLQILQSVGLTRRQGAAAAAAAPALAAAGRGHHRRGRRHRGLAVDADRRRLGDRAPPRDQRGLAGAGPRLGPGPAAGAGHGGRLGGPGAHRPPGRQGHPPVRGRGRRLRCGPARGPWSSVPSSRWSPGGAGHPSPSARP